MIYQYISIYIVVLYNAAECKIEPAYYTDGHHFKPLENKTFSHINKDLQGKSKDYASKEVYQALTNSIHQIRTADTDIPGNRRSEIKHYDKYNNAFRHAKTEKSGFDLEIALKDLDKKVVRARRTKLKEIARNTMIYGSMFQGCSNESYPKTESRSIKTYKIDLDAKPEERWREVLRDKHKQIEKLANFFEGKFGSKLMKIVDKYISWLLKTLPKEYQVELIGMAKETGLNIGRVTLYNVFYEFFTVCTSIVMESEDGHLYHGRNLDFGLFMGWDPVNHTWYITELLRPLIIKVDFIKNGKLLYSAVTYAGYTGILTGVKKNKFSLTIDERFLLFGGGYVGLAEWILGHRDMSWLGLLTRQVMESAETYEQAQKILTTTPLVAPVYFILAGNSSHQGCIITRGRRDSDIWNLGNRHEGQKGSWYLIETNYDHWKKTPFIDNRRQYAIQCMDQIGREQPLETLYRVLSTKPVLNKETTLTAVMDVSLGLLQVWERKCPDPCWPF